jgi:UDP-N-acetylmuramoyl-tripeptide--D-alanyl-D-alanine ligase
VRAYDVVDEGIWGTRFDLDAGDGERRPVHLRIAGRHNVANALAAVAAARAIDVSLDRTVAALGDFEAPSMRMEVLRLDDGVIVLNDCYNANPGSMAAALQTLRASTGERRIAALGEMLELGAAAESAHRELGTRAAAAALDALYLMGSHAAAVRDGAIAGGLPADRITIAPTHDALSEMLRATLRAGDLLLLKGSRGAALEKVLQRLTG